MGGRDRFIRSFAINYFGSSFWGKKKKIERRGERKLSLVLSCKNLLKAFGKQEAVSDLTFSLGKEEILAILGPSGCGKSTLLRMISGFEKPDKGEILVENSFVFKEGLNIPPEKRNIMMVFQDLALFPHMNVFDNIAFGLLSKKGKKNGNGESKQIIKDRVSSLLSLVGLPGFEKKLPHTLSGGEQQRVALARALAPKPDVLLLDEPFSGLDAHLRVRLREDMKKILKANKTSVILVTHDQEEAFSFADRLLIMNKGELVQSGVGRELYNGPKNSFVASFLGEANFLTRKEAFYFKSLDKELVLEEEGKEEYILRPHDIILKKAGKEQDISSLKGVIKETQYLGEMMSYKLLVKSDEQSERTLVVKNFFQDFFESEEEVSFRIHKISGVDS